MYSYDCGKERATTENDRQRPPYPGHQGLAEVFLKLILKMNRVLPGGTLQAENSMFIRPETRKSFMYPRSGREPAWWCGRGSEEVSPRTQRVSSQRTVLAAWPRASKQFSASGLPLRQDLDV